MSDAYPIRSKVLHALSVAGTMGLTTDNVVQLLVPHTDNAIKAAQNVLYRLRKAGMIVRAENGVYTVPGAAPTVVAQPTRRTRSPKRAAQTDVDYTPALSAPEQVLVVTHAKKDGVTPAEWVRKAVTVALRRTRS